MDPSQELPAIRQTVLDATDARVLAEFYRQLLGMQYRSVDDLPEGTWPQGPRPQQLHLDLTAPTTESLSRAHQRAAELGGRLLSDRSDDPDEPLRVYADPAGHPFCIFVVGPDHDR